MKEKVFFIITIVNALLITAVVIFGIADETVPIHYGWNGAPDDFGSKWTYLLFAFIPLVLWAGMAGYGRSTDVKYLQNKKYSDKILPAILFVFIALGWYLTINVTKNSGSLQQSFPNYIAMVLGVLMMWISNYMAKIQRNNTLGLRLPWTVSNDYVWKKSQRFAGYSGFAGGILMIVCGILGLILGNYYLAMIGIIVGIILVAVVPSVYSWIVYKQGNDASE